MTDYLDWVSYGLATIGCFFFVAGSIGLLRLPDIYSRLHALTKADNVGLGLVILAVMLQQTSWVSVAKLFVVWVLVLVTSASVSMLTARASLRANIAVWRKKDA